jgi:ferritin-like metal-binding protein YciE
MENKNQSQQPKMNLQPAELKQYFIGHLNKIYCAKNHLVENFPAVLKLATFADLRDAIEDGINDLRKQIARMREIFQIMKEKYEPGTCQMFEGLISDLFRGAKEETGSSELRDMSIIYYLQNIESLEMASFHALQMAAVKFKNEDINALLKDNFDEAKTERTMLRLITAKYLTSKPN